MDKKKFNLDVLLKILILIGFSAFFFYLILSRNVSLYVHPRNTPYLLLAGVAMFTIAIFLVLELSSQKNTKSPLPLLFFMVPLILAFFVPAQPFDTLSGGYTALSLTTRANNSSQDFSFGSNNAPSQEATKEDLEVLNRSYFLELEDGKISMNDTNFARWLMEIYSNLDLYDQTPIELTGFVFIDDTLSSDEFVLSRMMMVCCVADLEMVGLLTKYEDTKSLESDSWLRVTGTLSKTKYQDSYIPKVIVNDISPIVPPRNQYVYPF